MSEVRWNKLDRDDPKTWPKDGQSIITVHQNADSSLCGYGHSQAYYHTAIKHLFNWRQVMSLYFRGAGARHYPTHWRGWVDSDWPCHQETGDE